MIFTVQKFKVLDGLKKRILEPLSMRNLIELTSSCGHLIKHGSHEIIEVTVETLKQLSQFAL
jgi:hypothetical protein